MKYNIDHVVSIVLNQEGVHQMVGTHTMVFKVNEVDYWKLQKKNKYVSEADKVPRRMSVKLTKSLHAIEFPGQPKRSLFICYTRPWTSLLRNTMLNVNIFKNVED